MGSILCCCSNEMNSRKKRGATLDRMIDDLTSEYTQMTDQQQQDELYWSDEEEPQYFNSR
jgi:hypothetical protein